MLIRIFWVQWNHLLYSDLDLTQFSLEFNDLVASSQIKELRKLFLSALVKKISAIPGMCCLKLCIMILLNQLKFVCSAMLLIFNPDMFEHVKVAVARILAATPHSHDLERLTSACNLMKTAQTSSLDVKMENLHLYIQYINLIQGQLLLCGCQWNHESKRAKMV